MYNYEIYQMNLAQTEKKNASFSSEILAYIKSEFRNTVLINLEKNK